MQTFLSPKSTSKPSTPQFSTLVNHFFHPPQINDIFIGSDFSHQDVHDLFLKVTDDSGDSRILVELRKFAKNVVNHTAVAHCLDFPGPRCVKSDVAVQTELVMDDLKYFDREMSVSWRGVGRFFEFSLIFSSFGRTTKSMTIF